MFANTLSKTATAGILALSLAVTSLAPSRAAAELSSEEALFGLLTLFAIGTAINNRNSEPEVRAHPRTQRNPQRPQNNGRGNWRNLPSECQFTIQTRRGDFQRMYGQRCMINNYRQMNRLPEQCHVRVHNQNGQLRQGWRPGCLRNNGFRVNWR